MRWYCVWTRRARFSPWIAPPILALRPGLPRRQTYHYKRQGTTTRFATFNIPNGRVIATCQPRHRSREFVGFLDSNRKTAEVQRWLKPKRRNRFYFHFTPTSSSWLNRVERFFALITGRTIRLATFHSREELERAVATPFHPGVRGS